MDEQAVRRGFFHTLQVALGISAAGWEQRLAVRVPSAAVFVRGVRQGALFAVVTGIAAGFIGLPN